MSGGGGGGGGKRKRRSVDPISMSFLDVISCGFGAVSMSFLDVISCGFGAVILLFMMMNHNDTVLPPSINPDLQSEVDLLDEEILEGREGLVRIRNTISEVDQKNVEAQGLASRIQNEIDEFLEELAVIENSADTEEDEISNLQQDINALQEELEKLRAAEDQVTGNNIREFVGDGNRQYLTGMILGGNRILVLIDTSGSMLDNTIVNIIRRRNMDREEQLNSPKWQQVLKTVDWLSSQLPVPSQYQMYTFSNTAQPLLAGTENQWLEVADEAQLNRAIGELKKIVPDEGTNLENLFQTVAAMSPPPDNIFLITDGLPTLGSRGPTTGTISGRDREELFERALKEMPEGIPVNVIMSPLEGDPAAPGWYWQLAMASGGSFMMPSPDWP
jgi:hypothetical protein